MILRTKTFKHFLILILLLISSGCSVWENFTTYFNLYYNTASIFEDAENEILLIDAGHYETEIPALDEIKNRLEKSLIDKTKVYKYTGSTNPIVFYNN